MTGTPDHILQGGTVKRKIVTTSALCFVTLSLWAAPKEENYTGWISYSKCVAKGLRQCRGES